MIFFTLIGIAAVVLFVKFLLSEKDNNLSKQNQPAVNRDLDSITIEELIIVNKRQEQQKKDNERNYSLFLMAERWGCNIESLKDKFLNDLLASARLEEGVGYDLDVLRYADSKLISSIDEECRVLKISKDAVPSAIMHSWVQKLMVEMQETVEIMSRNHELYKAKKNASRAHRILSFAAISDSLECNPEDVEPLYKALMNGMMNDNSLSYKSRKIQLLQQREQHLGMVHEEVEALTQATGMLVNKNDTPGAIMAHWVLEILSEVESDEEGAENNN